MFPSISRALPNTQVTTSFRATTSVVLVLPVQDLYGNPFNITINNGTVQTGQVPGGTATTWTVSVTAGQLVTAIVTSPFNNLEHAFYEYTINGIYQNFAVVCESLYTIKVVPADAKKRWYDYSYTTRPTLSFRQANGAITVPAVYSSIGPITVNSHVVLNPFTKSVYFHDSITGIQTSVISFSSPPIDYQILTSHNKIVVLTYAGNWYEVNMASAVTPLPVLDITARCLGYNNTTSTVWIGGATTCWAYNISSGGMVLTGTCAVTEQIVGIVPLPNSATSAVAVSDNNNAYILDTVTGSSPLTPMPSTAIGQPVVFGNHVYIPDGNNAQLLAYNYTTAMFDTAVPTVGYSPKYTLVRNNNLYVTSNDSPDVLVFTSAMVMTKLIFRDKVTLVSASGSTAIASHFLNSISTTLAPSLTRIVDVTFNNRSGPITHIGSNTVKIITVGYQIVTGYTAGRTVLWVSGVKTDSYSVRGYEIIDGSSINLSYRVSSPGTSQVATVIGDSAFDYQITAFVEQYYPRYIDFLIGDSNNPSYTQTITMPNKMTPARMAIEYGDLKLNGIVYDGSTKVFANDVITITITLGNPYGYGKGMLPIFSLGARQFAIPISADPVPVVTTVVSDNNLSPNTALTKTDTITGNVSLYDFILPDYYNVKISKRMTSFTIPGGTPTVTNVDVSGNYYQPFGAGDILVVDYRSSVKLYDTEVVYILGPINYKFTANNSLPFLINYLDYGTLSNPYTRNFEPLTSGFGNSLMGPNGAITYIAESNHATDMQEVTSNIQIVGYITTAGNAVLTLSGGDTKFIYNGNTSVGSNVTLTNPLGNSSVITDAIEVYNGDQVALGRNVQSYFDGNITVNQNMLDIENDFVLIEVGKWRIVNQIVKTVILQPQETSVIINTRPQPDNNDDTILSLNYTTDTLTNNSFEMTYTADNHNTMVNAPYLVDYNSPTTAMGISALQWLQETTMVPAASVLQWLQETMLIPQTTTLQWLQETTMVPTAGVLQWLQETTMVPAASIREWLQETTMVPAASQHELAQDTAFVIRSSTHDLLQETTMIPKSSTHDLLQETTMLPKSSTHDLLHETTMLPKSSTHDLLHETIMMPAASRRELAQDTAFAIRSSTHDLLHETIMMPAASQHSLIHNSEYNIPTSKKELYQVGELLTRSSNMSLESRSAFTPRMAPLEWDNLINLQLPMSTVVMNQLPIEQVYLNSPSIEHKVYVDGPNMQWIQETLAKSIKQPTLPNIYSKYFVIDTNAYDFNTAQYGLINSHQEYKRSFFAPEIIIDTIPGFAGERYTPVNSIFDRSVEGTQLLILATMDRNPYENYDYKNTKFTREDKSSINTNTNLGREPVLGYVLLDEQFDYETRADITLAPEFTRELHHNIELTADYNIYENRRDMPIVANYTIIDNLGDRTIPTDYSISESKHKLQLVVDYAQSTVANKTLLVVDYIPGDTAQKISQNLTYQLELLENKNIVINYKPVPNALLLTVKPEYEQIVDSIGFTVKPEYEQIVNMLSFTVKPTYEQIVDTIGFTVKPEYEQDLSMSIYGNSTKLIYEVDPELLWKQDVSTDYLVFNTAQDALDKAIQDGYTNYSAYQVYDTPYYSYRILIDTALVCKLPKGRYPIAWLLHGG